MRKIIFTTLLFLLMLGGCASKSYVKFVDNSIEREIQIKDVKKRVLENGLTQVQISGVNDTDKYMKFRYRVEWEDKDGFEVPSISSNWAYFPAHKKSQFKINVVAPNTKATEYQIYIDK